jgi:hypothetical protein
MNELNRSRLFVGLCAIALLATGAHISQSYVNYPGWHLMDQASFRAYHGDMFSRAVVFLLLPRVLEIALGLTVLRFRPMGVDRWVILLGVSLAAGGLVCTMLLQRPLNDQLDIQGNVPELLSRLMATDWIRNSLEFARAGLYVWALSKVATVRGDHRSNSSDVRFS